MIEAFSAGMVADLGPRLQEIWIFGSRARRDAGEDSDYDFLVVADCPRSLITEASVAVACDVFDRFGAQVGPVNYDSRLWERAKSSSLGRIILAEGVKLYERQSLPA
ncbi:MAG: nucleotidyltransferase domain-containing protein [Spirochaetales bacterium]|nr:nucleotidyltransferase domain-containing protein [Spirochaetales bacterium]